MIHKSLKRLHDFQGKLPEKLPHIIDNHGAVATLCNYCYRKESECNNLDCTDDPGFITSMKRLSISLMNGLITMRNETHSEWVNCPDWRWIRSGRLFRKFVIIDSVLESFESYYLEIMHMLDYYQQRCDNASDDFIDVFDALEKYHRMLSVSYCVAKFDNTSFAKAANRLHNLVIPTPLDAGIRPHERVQACTREKPINKPDDIQNTRNINEPKNKNQATAS